MTQPSLNGNGGDGVMLKLSVLMFLQFFIWGSWYLSVSLFMFDNEMGSGRFYAYTAGPLAAIIAPFFTGLIADRFINTEKVLALLFLAAGACMLALPWAGGLTGTTTETADDGTIMAATVTAFGMTMNKSTLFNGLIVAHMLCYMPTLGLSASLAFTHLRKSEQFPLVRLWGTIGWIVAGFVLALVFTRTLDDGTVVKGETQAVQFILGGAASVMLGFFCFSLPKTPAPLKGKPVNMRDLVFADAWAELRRIPFAVFIIGSFLVCIPLAAYYASLQQQMEAMNMTYIAAWKNTGTFLEAGMMFMMPFFFRKLGIRWMILIGIGAWVLRYILFALGATPEGFALVIAGIALHGICYDFFFVTGQVYVDKATRPEIRGQAQGMLIFFTQGLGLYFGALATQQLAGRAFGDTPSTSPESLPMWPDVWWPLAGMAAVILVIFGIAFRDKQAEEAMRADSEITGH